MERIEKTPGTISHTIWRIQHYYEPDTASFGYDGWGWSNPDCFPHEAYSASCDGWQKTSINGFLTEEIGLKMLEVVRTKKFQRYSSGRTVNDTAFPGLELRLVKYSFTETLELCNS
jgi:hypothetical protein